MDTICLDHMGSDLTVVNAARVSMHKESSWEEDGEKGVWDLRVEDEKLIKYLAKHKHWTPFAHPQLQFHIEAPLFVARQMWKSHVGTSGGDVGYPAWNEISRRYVDEEPKFYIPKEWRLRADNVKQGSKNETIESWTTSENYGFLSIKQTVMSCSKKLLRLYNRMLHEGIAPEMARMVLPQNMYTEWHWTGSLMFFARVCKLRLDSHAQKESQIIAQSIAESCALRFPVSWAALMETNDAI